MILVAVWPGLESCRYFPITVSLNIPDAAAVVAAVPVFKLIAWTAVKLMAEVALPAVSPWIPPPSFDPLKVTVPVGLTSWTTTKSHSPISRLTIPVGLNLDVTSSPLFTMTLFLSNSYRIAHG